MKLDLVLSWLLITLPLPLAGDDHAAQAAEVKTAVAAFEKRFRGGGAKPPSAEERRAALAALDGFDDPLIAQALVGAKRRGLAEVAANRKERDDVFAKSAELLQAISEGLSKGSGPKPEQMAKLDKLNTRMKELAGPLAAAVVLDEAIERRLSTMNSVAAVEWLLANVIGADDFSRTVKVATAHNAADRGEPRVAALEKSFARAKGPDDLVALLDGVATCGPAARSCQLIVRKQFAHVDAEVRAHAAGALARLEVAAAIEPLVVQLGVERGATRSRFGFALETLTHARFGSDAAAWRDWLAHDGAPLASGAVALPPAEPRRSSDFFGIPLEGRSFVFVVDCSAWMLVDASQPKWVKKIAQMQGPSRLDVTKRIVVDLLGSLRADDRFDVVAFADEARVWSRRLVAATPAAVLAAQEFTRALSTAVGTFPNTHDALVAALDLRVDETVDAMRREPGEPDALFLVTAGAPQRPGDTAGASVKDPAERILDDVAARNRERTILVNAVALGRETDESLLERLAKANGGSFERR